MKLWLHDNDIEKYSTHNEGKSVVAERYIRILKDKIYKNMIVVSKNGYIDRLDEIVGKYNKIYHRAIKMKPDYVQFGTYIDYGVEHNDKGSKFKVGEHGRASKFKNIFAKGWTPISFEEVFTDKKIKNTVSWAYVISSFNNGKIAGTFYEKELQKISQIEVRVEKVIK